MSVRRLAPDAFQPAEFAFSNDNLVWARHQIEKYPSGRQASAVIPLLWKAQEQHDGWVPRAAIEEIGRMLSMPYIRVLEVATFYTMFNLEPVGRYFIQLCGTTPCMLCGAEALKSVCQSRIGDQRHVSSDGMFSWLEVECLGACCNAPMVQINNDYYEDLTPESFGKLLDDLAAGKPVKIGPQNGRLTSEPAGGATTLTDASLFDGSKIGAWRKRFDEAASDQPTHIVTPPVAAPVKPAPASLTAKPVAKTEPVVKEVKAKVSVKTTAEVEVSDANKPGVLAAPRGGKADDLSLIWGVGPKLVKLLNEMGFWHFDQIASWTDTNIAWVDQNLGTFKGRPVRDKWKEQATKLATGWRPDSKLGDKPEGVI